MCVCCSVLRQTFKTSTFLLGVLGDIKGISTSVVFPLGTISKCLKVHHSSEQTIINTTGTHCEQLWNRLGRETPFVSYRWMYEKTQKMQIDQQLRTLWCEDAGGNGYRYISNQSKTIILWPWASMQVSKEEETATKPHKNWDYSLCLRMGSRVNFLGKKDPLIW